MKPKFLNGFLRDEEKGVGGDGGGASNVIVLPGAEAGGEGEAAGGETAGAGEGKVGFLDSVLGSLKTKGALVAEMGDLKGKLSAADGEVLRLKGELETLQGEHAKVKGDLAALQGERAQIEAALKASQAEVTSVEEKALEQVAGLGFSAEKLPEAAAEDAVDNVEALEQALAKETDPRRIYTLNQELEAAKKAKKAAKAG
jgi:chromosome segregation ATPase